MICLSSTRFSMTATLINPSSVFEDIANPAEAFEGSQDPLSGEIVRKWDKKKVSKTKQFPCLARGIVAQGIRGQGNTEDFGAIYASIEYVRIWLPPYVNLKKDDKITDIRDSTGQIVFMDEEYLKEPRATIFNVEGVTPMMDPLNRMYEKWALLERAQ